MYLDELYKFCDGMFTSVRTVLFDNANNLRMEYLPKGRWSNLDRKRSRIMIKAIDQQLFERRMAKDTIDTVTSILTQKELYAFFIKRNIPASVEPQLPGPDDTIRNSLDGKIGNFISNVWLSFKKHIGRDTLCCYTKNVNSLKKWNNHFFWINASIVLISISWFEGVFVENDPPPSDDIENLDFVEMGQFNFIKSFDPFKVKVRERTLAEGELPLIKETEDKGKKRFAFESSQPPVKKVRKDVASSVAPPQEKKNPSVSGKTPATLRNLVNLGTLVGNVEIVSSTAAMDACDSESVTPSPTAEYEDELDSVP
nr:hypothetical protein [Tanacetum cinerariifolium]